MENPDYLGMQSQNPGQSPKKPSILFNPTPITSRLVLLLNFQSPIYNLNIYGFVSNFSSPSDIYIRPAQEGQAEVERG
jgi:hypothetical protein